MRHWDAFQEDRELVYEKLCQGHIDHVEVVSRVLETQFTERQVLQLLLNALQSHGRMVLPTPKLPDGVSTEGSRVGAGQKLEAEWP